MVLFYIMHDHGNELKTSKKKSHSNTQRLPFNSVLFFSHPFSLCWALAPRRQPAWFRRLLDSRKLSQQPFLLNPQQGCPDWQWQIKGFKKLSKIELLPLDIYAPFSGYLHLKVSHLLHLFGPNIRFNNHIDMRIYDIFHFKYENVRWSCRPEGRPLSLCCRKDIPLRWSLAAPAKTIVQKIHYAGLLVGVMLKLQINLISLYAEVELNKFNTISISV